MTTSQTVVPISQLRRTLPTVGRIRAGKKTDSGRPTKIHTWRFTSADREAVDAIAELYGGTVERFTDPKIAGEQWQVTTDTREVRVYLPPDCLDGPSYEMWGGAGRERRCDGETAVVSSKNGHEFRDVSQVCVCNANGVKECDLKIRLSVVIPELKLKGVWRVDTKSEAAAQEIPGMVDAIFGLQAKGLQPGQLILTERNARGGARQFNVPVLGIGYTADQLVAGGPELTAGNGSPQLETGGVPDPAPVEGPPVDDDDVVVDGEIVEDDVTLETIFEAAKAAGVIDRKFRSAKTARGAMVTAIGELMGEQFGDADQLVESGYEVLEAIRTAGADK